MDILKIQSKLSDKYGYQKLSNDLSEKYRNFWIENLPNFISLDGSNDRLYNNSGTLICNGYKRIVIGDYGAFIEFDSNQANISAFVIKLGQEYRLEDTKYSLKVKYLWYTTIDDSDVKIYFQKRKVNYADYIRDMFYVSPHEIFLEKVLTD